MKAEIISSIGESEFIKGAESVQVIYFLLRYKNLTDSDEDRETKWCTYQIASEVLSFEDTKRLLKIAHESVSLNLK